MSDQFVAEIRLLACNFPPRGWAFCNGQLLPISQNTALFSLLGTNYGGDGKTNFALPNLQASLAGFYGQGPGLSLRSIGEEAGVPSVTLLTSEMPGHVHALQAANTNATSADPSGKALARGAFSSGTQSGAVAFYQTAAPNVPMSPAVVGPQGSGQPHNNLMPYQALNFCIALQGIFPPRG